MAGDWTKMRDDLASDPAVITMAAQLQIHVDEVVGKLLRAWAWAGKHTTNGVVKTSGARVLDCIIGAEKFSSALASVGWLEIVDDNTIRFPRWNTHNSKSAKRRALDSKRKADIRWKGVRKVSVSEVEKMHAREEKRREEKSKGDKSPLDPLSWTLSGGWKNADAYRPSWISAYPLVDIDGELRRMTSWLIANPAKAKKKNWARFATNWLDGQQNDAEPRGKSPHNGLVECGPVKSNDPRLEDV